MSLLYYWKWKYRIWIALVSMNAGAIFDAKASSKNDDVC